ncbi:MAG: chalcone isomerase family protein [Rhodoferax sp.]|nr:chalcone isomerase family protein [Rhodoferax sp.]
MPLPHGPLVNRRQALGGAATALALAGWAPAVQAQERAAPPEVLKELPGARMQGGGRLRFFGMHLYDIWLFTGAQKAAANWAAVPLALEIEYARAFDGDSIAERSLKEMRRQAEINDEDGGRWTGAMQVLFPDVRAGDRLTGVQRPGQAARFYFNGQYRGEVAEALFTRLFFGIWLSARSGEPLLREALLGSTP